MRQRQKVSRAGVELIKSFEGLRATAARLPDGRWTLGYGHTFSAREGARVTQEDADALLRFDLLPIVDAINNMVLVPLNQNQFDALVSFCFNIGVENFGQSSVLKCINEGRITEAALAMDSWRSAEFNGQTYVLAPLIRRRAAEKNLFLTPEDNGGNAPSMLVRPTLDASPATSAAPFELASPDRGGVLSPYPMSAPGFSPYANPPQAAQPFTQPVPQPAPLPEREVIDLNAFAPRPVEAVPYPYATPREQVVEQLPDGIVSSSAIRAVPVAPTLQEEPQMSPAVQAALVRAQEEQRLKEETRLREVAQREAAAAARAAEEARLQAEREDAARQEEERLLAEQRARAEQARIEQEAFERARLEREAEERAEQQRAEEVRLAAVKAEEERLEREKAAQAAAVAAAPEPLSDEAEKQRKAEAAAALMRLYSPYGGGGLGRPLSAPVATPPPVAAVQVPLQQSETVRVAVAAPEPLAQAPVAEPVAGPVPVAEREFSNTSIMTPQAPESAPLPVREEVPVAEAAPEARDEIASVVDFVAVASPRTMAPPTVVALNPYARATLTPPVSAPEASVRETAPVSSSPEPEVVEVPRPQPVDMSATPGVDLFSAKPGALEALNWREQMQRPLTESYQAPESDQASLLGAAPSQYGALYQDDNEEWTMDGGRIAVATDEHEHEERNVFQMIMDTVWWIVISGLGLGCLGVAAAAYTKSHDPSVIRNGFFNDYTSLSLIMAVAGILFVSISVWLIMKRLGGLKD